ncbi:hypothetical protein DFJ74DRAFT_653496 [Hyaloraphidium curvatum]|nr:hypothetical protein DFJ74DRAFT_653496 [Hyaloraphidium curvatum]
MLKQALRRAQRFFTESIPEAAETVIDSFKAIFAEMSNDSPAQHEAAAAIASIDTPTEEQTAAAAAVQTVESPEAAEVSTVIPIALIVAPPCAQTGIDIVKVLKDSSDAQTSPAFEPKDIKDSVSDALALDEVIIPTRLHSLKHLRESIELSTATIETDVAEDALSKCETDSTYSAVSEIFDDYTLDIKLAYAIEPIIFTDKDEQNASVVASIVDLYVEPVEQPAPELAAAHDIQPAAELETDQLQIEAWATLGLNVTRDGAVDAYSDSDSTAAPSPTSTGSSCGSDDTIDFIDQCRIKFQILKAKVFKPRKARPALANPKSPAALAIANNLLDLFTASFEQGAAFANFVAVLESTEELGRTPKECLDARARPALALLKTLGGVRDWLASTSGYVRRLKVVHDAMAGITGAAYAFLATVEQYQSELRGFARQMNGATGQACERMAGALEGVKTGLRTLVRGLVVVAKQIQMACRMRALSYPRKSLRFEHLAALCDGVADLSCIVEGGNLEAEQELLSLEGNIFDAYDFAPRALIAELEALDRK